jgi:hypothetical protein
MNDTTSGRGRRRVRSRRAGVLAVALAGTALLAAACGGGGSSAGASAAEGSSAYQDAVAYAQCMRSHGVPAWPDPTSQGNFKISGGNMGPAQQKASADKVCKHLLLNGGQVTAAQTQHFLDQALKFAACIRAHGIANYPDPTVQNGDIHLGPPEGSSGFDTNSPRYQSAQQACRPLLPGGGS